MGLGPGPAEVFTLELHHGDAGLEIRAGAGTNDGHKERTDWAPIRSTEVSLEIDWRRSAEDRWSARGADRRQSGS